MRTLKNEITDQHMRAPAMKNLSHFYFFLRLNSQTLDINISTLFNLR
jgi:hypothetical protein